jgi:AbrB family looped-hinge helix DNA binding protein
MRATIDAAGRIVVPKLLREALGVRPGQALELQVRDGRLEIELAPVDMRLERGPHGSVAVPAEPVPTLSAEVVRETLERTRR